MSPTGVPRDFCHLLRYWIASTLFVQGPPFVLARKNKTIPNIAVVSGG
jgi:hypothetical protein